MTFTGISDLDMEILTKMDDRELGKICSTNNYFKNLCKDENFWRNRFMKRFGKYFDSLETVNKIRMDYSYSKWRDYYISYVEILERLYSGDIVAKIPKKYISIYREDYIIRKDFKILKEYMDKIYTNFQKEITENFDNYKWKEMLRDDLINPNVSNNINSYLTEPQIKILSEYILSLDDRRINPFKILTYYTFSATYFSDLIYKIINDPRINYKYIIKLIGDYIDHFDFNILNIYLDFIKNKGKIDELLKEIQELDEEPIPDVVKHIIKYLNLNFLDKIYDILKAKDLNEYDHFKILKFIEEL